MRSNYSAPDELEFVGTAGNGYAPAQPTDFPVQPTRFCTHCGQQIAASVAFCPYCGGPATQIPTRSAPVQPTYQTSMRQAAPQQPVYQINVPTQPAAQQPIYQPNTQQPPQPGYQQASAQQIYPPYYQPNIIINNANTNTNTNTVTNTVVVRGGREKNKWVSVLLCLFLGVVGGHKFYEGKIGMGILYLLTAGLFGIGCLIDLISLLLKPNPYYV
jgi:Predicted membrane protein